MPILALMATLALLGMLVIMLRNLIFFPRLWETNGDDGPIVSLRVRSAGHPW